MANQKPTPAVGSSELVLPQPGEVWLHYYHGPVLIVRKWLPELPHNDEYVCEIEMKAGRRMILSESCFEGLLRQNNRTELPAQ